jgi:hypothetical protein
VNQSAGPLFEGCEPARVTFMVGVASCRGSWMFRSCPA